MLVISESGLAKDTEKVPPPKVESPFVGYRVGGQLLTKATAVLHVGPSVPGQKCKTVGVGWD